ncbi:hypothetical protein FDY93_04185 [Microbulbifer harenosus]|uniref:Uncharacterized protein n=2 Tax=Microbulbiferaceae TaxID=1706373 RepID=A0ABY2ULJ6_9GAMM|nr:hypothetical protein FDY93_04185 [Microbulbifer harenosus]
MGNPVINVKYSQRSLRAAITGAPEQPDYSDGEAPQKIAIKAKTVIDASPERVMKCNFVRADHKKYKTNNKKTQELVKPQYE